MTFLYNGGPGSASLWLHLGAFGPRRIVTAGGAIPPGAGQLIDNPSTLLDASDLVFIDSRYRLQHDDGKGADKDFWASMKTSLRSASSSGAGSRRTIARAVRNSCWARATARSVGGARRPVQKEGIDVNGVILVSSVLDFG